MGRGSPSSRFNSKQPSTASAVSESRRTLGRAQESAGGSGAVGPTAASAVKTIRAAAGLSLARWGGIYPPGFWDPIFTSKFQAASADFFLTFFLREFLKEMLGGIPPPASGDVLPRRPGCVIRMCGCVAVCAARGAFWPCGSSDFRQTKPSATT